MKKISNIKARQVFDSRGIPTIESEVFLDDGKSASAIVPSGASTGSYEAFELRDTDNKEYLGKSVLKAIEKVNGEIAKALLNQSPEEQKKIDKSVLIFKHLWRSILINSIANTFRFLRSNFFLIRISPS